MSGHNIFANIADLVFVNVGMQLCHFGGRTAAGVLIPVGGFAGLPLPGMFVGFHGREGENHLTGYRLLRFKANGYFAYAAVDVMAGTNAVAVCADFKQ